jgi:hypothetical protein
MPLSYTPYQIEAYSLTSQTNLLNKDREIIVVFNKVCASLKSASPVIKKSAPAAIAQAKNFASFLSLGKSTSTSTLISVVTESIK